MSELKNCKFCNAEIAKSAKTCPQCGGKNKKPLYKKWWLWVGIFVLIVSIGSSMGGNETPNITPNENTAQSEKKPMESNAPKNNIPAEHKSALKKAKIYSDMHMSKKGIYKQLTSEYGEKFSPEAAQYAIDNVEADWKANALAKAKTYQDSMAMSPEAIRDQLTSEYGEQFTKEEADYAIEHLNK